MPKIVDHEAQRRHIIECAIPLFRAKGYHALGMREIAREVGVSKSALYHYYSSKQSLFEACSGYMTAPELPALPLTASVEQRYEVLLQVARQLDEDFQGELSLLLDYIRAIDRAQLQQDVVLSQALLNLQQTMTVIVGPKHAPAALAHLLGILLIRVFDGGQHSFEALIRYCEV